MKIFETLALYISLSVYVALYPAKCSYHRFPKLSLSTSLTQQNHHVLLRSPHSLCLGLVGSPVILSLMSRHLFLFAHDHSLGMSIVPKS